MGNQFSAEVSDFVGWCVGRPDKDATKAFEDSSLQEMKEAGNETLLIETRGSEMATLDKMLYEG